MLKLPAIIGALLLLIPQIAPESRSVLITCGRFFLFAAVVAALGRSKTKSNAPAIAALILSTFAFIAAFERSFIFWLHTNPAAPTYTVGIAALVAVYFLIADRNGVATDIFGGVMGALALVLEFVFGALAFLADLLEAAGTYLFDYEKRYMLIEKVEWVVALIRTR